MRERFKKDVEHHEMAVLHDHDGYLHLRFKQPGTGMYWFDIVTWPGTLAVRGDMGNFVFARVADMLEFFRHQAPNPQYWAEKEVTGAPTREYSRRAAAERVMEAVSDENLEWQDWSDVEQQEIRRQAKMITRSEDFHHREGYRYLVDAFVVPFLAAEEPHCDREFRFFDSWDWDVEEFTAQYLWCCEAIVWAIKQYDDAT